MKKKERENLKQDLLSHVCAYINCTDKGMTKKNKAESSPSSSSFPPMDSSATLGHRPKLIPKQCDTFFPAASASRRTPSFSSISSSSSSLESLYFAADDSLLSPSNSPSRFSGVPFSWEKLPGIPKKQTLSSSSRKNLHESSMKLLPLPPPTTVLNSSNCRKKTSLQTTFQKDPFLAAMVECSKDEDDHEEEDENAKFRSRDRNLNNKVSRSISDRFGFINLYSSCKRHSAVSESIIYLPTSRRRSNYQHFTRRSLSEI